jgi:hypothetical protein
MNKWIDFNSCKFYIKYEKQLEYDYLKWCRTKGIKMDEEQLKYQRVYGYSDDELNYHNYKIAFEITNEGRLIHRRTTVLEACCKNHAYDLANKLRKDNERIIFEQFSYDE